MKKHHLIIAALIGSGLEYYSYINFLLLSSILSRVFFPTGDFALVKTFMLAAVSYLCYPIGALFFGTLGDRIGRKKIFLLSIWLMSMASVLIGCLPSYNQIGAWAISYLVVLRILQGLSQGAEITGGMVYIAEQTTAKTRGLSCGFMLMGVGLGASLSSLVVYLLHVFFSHQQMVGFAWRIPFLLSLLLGIVAYWFRRHSDESPEFTQQKQHYRFALLALLKQQPASLVHGILLVLFGACLVTFGLLLPSLLQAQYHYSSHLSLLALTIGLSGSAPFLPLFGWLSDRHGRKRCYLLLLTLSLFYLPVMVWLIGLNDTWIIFMSILLYHILLTGLAANYVPLLTEFFATEWRYTGVGISYTLCFSLAGALPMVVGWLLLTTASLWPIIGLLVTIGVMTLLAVLRLQTRKSV